MISMKMVQFSRPLTPLSIYVQFSSTPLTVDVQFQTKRCSPNDNQSVKRKYNPRMTIRSFLQVGFRFQYQFINLAWRSIDFFPFSWSHSRPQRNFEKFKIYFLPSSYSEKMHWGQGWSEASLSTFSWLYILVCATVQKYREMFSQKKFFRAHFAINMFHCITWKRKQTMEQQPPSECEWTKSNKKTTATKKSHHIQIEHEFYCSI